MKLDVNLNVKLSGENATFGDGDPGTAPHRGEGLEELRAGLRKAGAGAMGKREASEASEAVSEKGAAEKLGISRAERPKIRGERNAKAKRNKKKERWKDYMKENDERPAGKQSATYDDDDPAACSRPAKKLKKEYLVCPDHDPLLLVMKLVFSAKRLNGLGKSFT